MKNIIRWCAQGVAIDSSPFFDTKKSLSHEKSQKKGKFHMWCGAFELLNLTVNCLLKIRPTSRPFIAISCIFYLLLRNYSSFICPKRPQLRNKNLSKIFSKTPNLESRSNTFWVGEIFWVLLNFRAVFPKVSGFSGPVVMPGMSKMFVCHPAEKENERTEQFSANFCFWNILCVCVWTIKAQSVKWIDDWIQIV